MHRVRAAREMIEKVTHILVQQGIDVQQLGKLAELSFIRQRPVDQQISNLNERRFFDQFLNRDPAVPQNSPFAVDKRNAAVAGAGIHQTGVDRNISCLFSELRDVKCLFPFASGHDRKTDFTIFDLQHNKFAFFHEQLLQQNSPV